MGAPEAVAIFQVYGVQIHKDDVVQADFILFLSEVFYDGGQK